jgi:hypothetical protein
MHAVALITSAVQGLEVTHKSFSVVRKKSVTSRGPSRRNSVFPDPSSSQLLSTEQDMEYGLQRVAQALAQASLQKVGLDSH